MARLDVRVVSLMIYVYHQCHHWDLTTATGTLSNEQLVILFSEENYCNSLHLCKYMKSNMV